MLKSLLLVRIALKQPGRKHWRLVHQKENNLLHLQLTRLDDSNDLRVAGVSLYHWPCGTEPLSRRPTKIGLYILGNRFNRKGDG